MQLIKIIIATILIIFSLNFNIYANNLITLDNTTININAEKNIENILSSYIKSGIPFKVNLKIYLKQFSNLFFLKDKIIKTFNQQFKFSYDIIKKKYIIVYKDNYFSTNNYNDFIKKISTFKISNFLPEKILKKTDDYYISLNISYIPLKGSFSIKNIYIFPKIEEFSLEKKFKLGELIGQN